jgi:hypothetical protein
VDTHARGAEPPSPAAIGDAARGAFELAAALDWKSYDPYDALMSPLGRRIRSRSWLGARVVVQLGKRTGAGFRRALGVTPHDEAKTLADFLRSSVMLATCGEEWAGDYSDELSRRLRSKAVAAEEGSGWGLDFPYASRFINVEEQTPNLYTTIGACQALLDHHGLTRDPASLEAAAEGARFILDGLGSFEYGGREWLRYWRGVETPTVNVQALAASMLARAGTLLGDRHLFDAADRAAGTVVSSSLADGSWHYSADGRAPFIDGFHTGFTLQGMAEYGATRGAVAVTGTRESVSRGFAYFKKHLLTDEGLPRGFVDGRVSLDGQNVAQCIQTLLVCGDGPDDRGLASRLWDREIEALLLDGGASRHRFPALRWTLGPAVLATAHLLRAADG